MRADVRAREDAPDASFANHRHMNLETRSLVPWIALAGVTALLAATPLAQARSETASKAPASGTYNGTTSEKSTVTFSVGKGGKTITSFVSSLAYNGKCGQGGGPGFEINVSTMMVSKSGHFSATTIGKVNAATGTIQVAGKIAGHAAAGTIVEPKPFFTCRPPHQKVNPYSESFTAKTS